SQLRSPAPAPRCARPSGTSPSQSPPPPGRKRDANRVADVSRPDLREADRQPAEMRRLTMAATSSPQSGTKDKNYDLITVTHLCLERVWRLDQYAQDAERDGDSELAALFRRMQEHSRKGAAECKQLLAERLQRDE